MSGIEGEPAVAVGCGTARCRARRLPLWAKFFLSMALVAAVVVGASVTAAFALRKGRLLEDLRRHVRAVAGTAAAGVDGALLNSIRSNADTGGPEFAKVRALLEAVRAASGLTEREVYIVRPVGGNLAEVEFVAMLHERPFVGDRYRIRDENLGVFRSVWEGRGAASTEVYQDEHGRWISGYGSVRDAAGKPVAVLEIAIDERRYTARLAREVLVGCSVGAGAFLVAMVPGLFLARGITRSVERLADGLRRFQSGDYGTRVDLKSGDEVEALAGMFNEMIRSLSEKLALLPFVSRFTAEAVRKSRGNPALLGGAEMDVVVLFADLRGFTRFSEHREAHALVRELNRLLALQAEAVLSAGGDVDKFVGDAVMAVFVEDGSGVCGQALECARQLVRRVHEATEAEGWKLALGVGIHAGRAVVGSIGSEVRRDFTVVGHTVNLAARLCERAGGWQVLVRGEFYARLSEEDRVGFVAAGPLAFKNMSGRVEVFAETLFSELGARRELLTPAAPGVVW